MTIPAKEKRKAIKESLIEKPCTRCEEMFKDGTHPDHNMRCEECNSSLMQRWTARLKHATASH